MSITKIRTMVKLDLSTGSTKETTANVSCTLAHYIRAINILNSTARDYGIVYLPSESDEEYQEFIR